MLQYLIILLDKKSVPYCHAAPSILEGVENELMPVDVLRRGIVFAMKENLNIQFVYPESQLPTEYETLIESIDHSKIMPECQAEAADVLVLTNWKEHPAGNVDGATCIINASRKELREHVSKLQELLGRVARLNIVLTDIEAFKDEEIEDYKALLTAMSGILTNQYKRGRAVQLNLLTDRLLLTEMNNCGAGDTNVTLAPNGRFYLCPAFYHDDEEHGIGSLETGLNIWNPQLLRLDHAPICRHCDAYQCRRCVWMNDRLTTDLNTPSHQQCVIAHIERNASRDLLQKLKEQGVQFSDTHEIEICKELDPFNNYKQWK